jgi:solute:Na+ symporter, SSS family
MTVLLLLVLAMFLLAGMSSGRAAGSRDAYFVGNRSGSTVAIAGSLLATIVGGSATIGVAGLAYERGLTAAWWTLVGAMGLAVLGLLIAPRVRAFSVYTLPGLAGAMYGRRVGMAVALLTVVAWTGVVSGQLLAASHVLTVAGTGSTAAWILLFTGVLVVYAVVGGQRAIIRTDVLQAGVILGGLSAALVYVARLVGSYDAWRAEVPPGSLDFPVSAAFGWSEIATMLVLVGSVYLVGPDVYTRLLSARDVRTARIAALSAAALVIPVAFIVSALGLAARVLAPGLAAEQALPWLITNALPSSVGVLLLVALVAALMSSADSTLLGQSTIVADEVVSKLCHLDERHVVLAARIGVVVLALLSLLLALSLQGVIASLLFAYSVFTSGVVGPMLLGLLGGRYRPDGFSALVGICVGGACGFLGAIPWVSVPMKPYMSLIGLGLSIAVPLVLSYVMRRRTTNAHM